MKNHKLLMTGLTVFLFLLTNGLYVQEQNVPEKRKKITIEQQVWASPFKSQGKGGSCSIHSVISFLESEKYRSNKKKIELSQLYCHFHSYIEKIQHCLRLRNITTFRKGGHFGDVLRVIEKYGAMPYEAYEGFLNKEGVNDYENLYGELRNDFLRRLYKKAESSSLNIRWENGVCANPWVEDLRKILNEHMGPFPDTFTYDGKTYSPEEFARDVLNLPLNDYIKLTSYSYIPYYQAGELLLKDNWLHDDFYCLPIDEFISTIDHALNNNYSLVVDIHTTKELLTDFITNYADFKEDEVINQDVRDALLDNWLTSDIHLIHLVGMAHDETGKKYYMIKDSVGKELGYDPPVFFSENFFRARALAVMVHKNGIPKDIRKKLGVKNN